MIRRFLRLCVRLGLAGGAGYAVFKLVQAQRAKPAGMPSGDSPVTSARPSQPLVEPSMLQGLDLRKADREDEGDDNGQVTAGPAGNGSAPAAAAAGAGTAPASAPAPEPAVATEAAGAGWVEPKGGACPASHPVKAKLASGIYHLPGMTAYERTTPDRCYTDETAAEADGLRKAQR